MIIKPRYDKEVIIYCDAASRRNVSRGKEGESGLCEGAG